MFKPFKLQSLLELTLVCALLGLLDACSGAKQVEDARKKEVVIKTKGTDNACTKLIGGVENDAYPASFVIASSVPGHANSYYFCSATAVAHNLAISAAHCLRDASLTSPKTYRLLDRKITSANIGQNLRTWVQAKRVFRRPEMEPGRFDVDNMSPDLMAKDIAFFEFPSGSFSAVMQIEESTVKPSAGTSVNIVGYGMRNTNMNIDIITGGGLFQQSATHRLDAGSKYQPGLIGNLLFFVGTNLMPYHGDSGGPMILNQKIIGVFSAMPNDAKEAFYAGLFNPAGQSLISEVKTAGFEFGKLLPTPTLQPTQSPEPDQPDVPQTSESTSEDCE